MGCFLTALIFMGPRQETSGMNGIVDQKLEENTQNWNILDRIKVVNHFSQDLQKGRFHHGIEIP